MIVRKSLVTAAVVFAAVGLASCSDDSSDAASTSTPAAASSSAAATTTSTAAAAAGAPTAADLEKTLVTFADPKVPAAEKTKIIASGDKRLANVEKMNAALATYGELKFEVQQPKTEGNVTTAPVVVTSPQGAAPALPFTWDLVDGQWKLSDQTACTYLGISGAPCV